MYCNGRITVKHVFISAGVPPTTPIAILAAGLPQRLLQSPLDSRGIPAGFPSSTSPYSSLLQTFRCMGPADPWVVPISNALPYSIFFSAKRWPILRNFLPFLLCTAQILWASCIFNSNGSRQGMGYRPRVTFVSWIRRV